MNTLPGSASEDERARLLAMINANWMTQAIGAAATLGLPVLLARGAQDSASLAAATSTHEPSLKRLLQGLASLGLCVQQEDDRFSLTTLGALLDPDAPQSLHHWALLRTASWRAWGELEQSVRSGECHRKRTLGFDDFSHLDDDPQAAAKFHRAMRDLTRRVSAQVVRQTAFRGDEHVVDVGGGSGELLVAIVSAHPAMRGTVLDLGHAREGARALFETAALGGRCRFTAGSFFDPWPVDGDVFLLKSVLHDWDDDRAASILRRGTEAMRPDSRLLIVERIAPERWSDCAPHRAVAASDLNMLVGLSGRERTATEFGSLLGRCGLRIARVVPADADFSVIEAAPCD